MVIMYKRTKCESCGQVKPTNKLKEFRIEYGATQEELAQLIGVLDWEIKLCEQYIRPLEPEVEDKVATIFGQDRLKIFSQEEKDFKY